MSNRQYRRHLDRDRRRRERAMSPATVVTRRQTESEEPVSFRGTLEERVEDILYAPLDCFVLEGSKVYHKSDATHVSFEKEKTSMSHSDAENKGYRPCKTCYKDNKR